MSQNPEPAYFFESGEELSLSGPALVELIRGVVDEGVPFRFEAKGFSMFPFIRDGDIVTVSPAAVSSVGIGDVAALVLPRTGKLVLHRIVGKNGDCLLSKGDNTAETDGYVPQENVVGLVTGVERKGKRVSIGLGPERFLIRFISRGGLLFPLLLPALKLVRPFIRGCGNE